MEMVTKRNPLLIDDEGFKESIQGSKEKTDELLYDEFLSGDLYERMESNPREAFVIKKEIQPKKVVSQIGLALFIMSVMTLASQVILLLLVKLVYPNILLYSWFQTALSVLSVMGVVYPSFIFIVRRIPKIPLGEKKKLTVRQLFGTLLVCSSLMYIANFITMILLAIVSMFLGSSVTNPLEEMIGNNNLWLTVSYVVVLGPIMEEIIFRKLLLDRLKRFGDVPAILYSALAFGLFHMNFNQFIYAAVLGGIFAYVAIRTNTIKYTIVLHMIINGIGMMAGMLAILDNPTLLLLLFSTWMIVSIITGLCILIKYKKRLVFLGSKEELSKKRDYILNPGTIMYILFCIVMMVWFLIA